MFSYPSSEDATQPVFTNNLWPREVQRKRGRHQPAKPSTNSGGNLCASGPWRVAVSCQATPNTDPSSGGRQAAGCHCGADLAEGKAGRGKEVHLPSDPRYAQYPPPTQIQTQKREEWKAGTRFTTLTVIWQDYTDLTSAQQHLLQSVSRKNTKEELVKISPFYWKAQ